jgi:hypothetical protein
MYFGAAGIRRWVTWNKDELEEHRWTCQNIMHTANTVTYNMANDDESFNQEMKWQLLATCHTISKQECQTVLLANRVMEFCGLYIGWYLVYSGNHKHHFLCWYFQYKLSCPYIQRVPVGTDLSCCTTSKIHFFALTVLMNFVWLLSLLHYHLFFSS